MKVKIKTLTIIELVCNVALGFMTLCGIIIFIGYLYSQINCKKLTDIELSEWQQLANLTYGSLGIILGYLYFASKISIDRDNARKDRIRNRLKYIHEELIQAHKLIEQILNLNIKDNNQLSRIRSEIDTKFTLLSNNYLENNVDLIGFNDEEINAIIAVHSFINNSDIIFKTEFRSLKKANRIEEQEKYIDVLQKAMMICIQKTENL